MQLNLTPLPLAKLQRIADALSPFELRLVGGVVRDLLAGVPPGDIDLCTTATPDEIIACCNQAGLRFEPTGIDHGTITIIVEAEGFETTSLRRDVATDGRRATVAFTREFSEDAARRDFTINALYAELDGTLYDPTGGVDDVRSGTLRFIGDPAERIQEDYLRILRFYRFYARFGRTTPDEATIQALQDFAPRITSLPSERIHPEVMKLLSAENPLPALQLMTEHSPLLDLLGLGDANLKALASHYKNFGRTTPTERLACLLWHTDMPATLRRSHLHPSNAQMKILNQLEDTKTLPFQSDDPIAWAYRADYDLAPMQLRCRMAHKKIPLTLGNDALAKIASTPAPVFPVGGDDLIKAGFIPGPELGRMLNHLEDWWLNNGRPPRAACLHHLSEIH